MNLIARDANRGLLTRWIVANIVAIFINDVVSRLTHEGGAVLWIVSLGVLLVAPGLAQWLVLRLYFEQMSWRSWVVASALGQALGLLLGAVLIIPLLFLGVTVGLASSMGQFPYNMLILLPVAVASGVSIGRMQWRVLRRYIAGASERIWLLSNVAAQLVGYALLAPGTLTPTDFAQSLLWIGLGVAGGALGAYITGRALLRLVADFKAA